MSLKTRTILFCALLSAATLAVYWPVLHHDFVNYDDDCYVVQNRQINAGLTWQGLAWAFGRLHGDGTYWHPLTWVSHMVDCQLFGLKPAGHHLANLLFHALNSILVFLLFKRLTQAFWRSALLAALFALHPLQVDTVAWVAERKNLLSALFFFLTLWAYSRYAERRMQNAECNTQARSFLPSFTHHVSRFTYHASIFYLFSLLLFACGLMCKPVLVTVPFVLLLLDYWPLRRFRIPWFKVSGLDPKLEQGLLTSAAMEQQSVWRLVFEKVPFLALSAISCLITIASTRAVGALAEASSAFPLENRLKNALFSYVRYLGKALWPSNLAVFYPYPDEFPAWRTIACSLLLLGISVLAIRTARIRPYCLVGWFWFLGVLVPFVGLIQAGDQAMADRFAYVPMIGLFLPMVWGAAELTRNWRKQGLVLTTLAVAVLTCCAALSRRQTGYWQSSVTLFSHALAVTSDNARAHSNLGLALMVEGKTEEGIQHLLEALRLSPEHAIAHWAVGSGRARQGRIGEAVQHYEAALNLKPEFPEALNDLAWVKATHPSLNYRNGTAAVELAERACRLTEQKEPLFIGTLGAAYAEAGRFEDAVKTAERAKALAAATGQKELVEKNGQLLELYRAGKPYHEAERSRN